MRRARKVQPNVMSIPTAGGASLVFKSPRQGQEGLISSFMGQPILGPYSSISIDFRDQAMQFFAHHYLVNDTPLSCGHTGCFTTIYSRAPAYGYLANAVDAVAMASLANLNNTRHLRHAACEKYSLVLREMRLALAEPDHVMSDQILVTVMLLNLYETVTCDALDLSSWNRHAEGALTLVQLRGVNQLHTSIGRSIFFQLRTDILISCLQQWKPVPDAMVRWIAEAQELETAHDKPSSELADIIIRICALIASTKEDTRDAAISLGYVLDTLSIDEDLEVWSVKYEDKHTATTGLGDTKDTYFEVHHNHSCLSTAKTHNLCCCARLILHETLGLELSKCPSGSLPSLHHNSILAASYTATRKCIETIFSSVSFILGDPGDGQPRRDKVRASFCVALIWPLLLAGTTSATTPSEREWVALRLKEIEEATGVQRAKIAALCIRYRSIPDN